MDDKHQKTQTNLASIEPGRGEASEDVLRGYVSSVASQPPESPPETDSLMELICCRENLKKALKRVRQNRGAPGVDNMTVNELVPYLIENWMDIKEQLFKGTYKPQPVRQVDIPKPSGKGSRMLGIPTCLDRFVQQAVLQVLQKIIDPAFSDNSYGFRPGRSTHQAIAQSQIYIREGYRVVVDIDLEKFFDRVNHDKLMSELAKRIIDKRVLKLIRSFLQNGIMVNGQLSSRQEGTPQGSPLSPFLSNVMLDLFDKELERRNHKFCRYADDCNVYVRTQRAGDRVLRSLKAFLERKLKLKVNEQKSAIDKVYRRSFLGFTFTSECQSRRRVSPEALNRLKKKVREITRQGKGKSMDRTLKILDRYLRGWRSYYGFSEVKTPLKEVESWMYRKLRCAYWRQWKTGKNRYLQLIKRGVGKALASQTAGSDKGPWRISLSPAPCIAFPKAFFRDLGIRLT